MHAICTFRFLCQHACEQNADHVVQRQDPQHCARTFRHSLQQLRTAPSSLRSLLRKGLVESESHLSKFVHTTAVLRRRNSQSDCRHGNNRVCRSKPQRQPALFTRCKGVCSTLSRPWQPKQSKSSSFMIMNRTSGTDLRCLAEPQHH